MYHAGGWRGVRGAEGRKDRLSFLSGASLRRASTMQVGIVAQSKFNCTHAVSASER
jgi:hypothetical protein